MLYEHLSIHTVKIHLTKEYKHPVPDFMRAILGGDITVPPGPAELQIHCFNDNRGMYAVLVVGDISLVLGPCPADRISFKFDI